MEPIEWSANPEQALKWIHSNNPNPLLLLLLHLLLLLYSPGDLDDHELRPIHLRLLGLGLISRPSLSPFLCVYHMSVRRLFRP